MKNENETLQKNVIYWILFLQGIGLLFPWNSIINGADYFVKKFLKLIYQKI